MKGPFSFVLQHPYAVLFGVVFVEQLGIPLPAVPFLLGAGALAGMHKLNVVFALSGVVTAALVADLVWYEAGRRKGASILKTLCRISLEPDSCVRRTEDVFARHGVRTLLVAKFLPGLNTVAPPMAGMIGMGPLQFVVWDAAGTLVWAGSFFAAGFLLSDQIESVAAAAARLGGGLAGVLAGLFAVWLGYRLVQRQLFICSLRLARIRPEELKRRLDAGESVVIVDLRGSLDFAHDPRSVPGSMRLSAEELAERHHEIPRDREVVLYCT